MTNFRQFAENTLKKITDQIETQDKECVFDIDNEGDILSIHSSKGHYVINLQMAKSEIWLSSPISGPYHFAVVDGEWIDKGGDSLCQVLSNELTSISKQDIIINLLDDNI